MHASGTFAGVVAGTSYEGQRVWCGDDDDGITIG